jgi:hypothetical protein
MGKFYYLLFFLSFFRAHSQHQADTSFVSESINASISNYVRTIHGQTSLYNGSQYRKPDQTDEQHPFFGSDDWVYGNVQYNNQIFLNVPLLYDITSDKLITENINAAEIQLVYEKLSGFTIGTHRFVKIESKSLPRYGFYELLYGGPSQAVALRQKFSREKIISLEIVISFDEKTRYFVLKNNTYFPVKSKTSLLRIFADEKTALKQFLAKNKLRYKKDPATALRMVAAEYDMLKKRP